MKVAELLEMIGEGQPITVIKEETGGTVFIGQAQNFAAGEKWTVGHVFAKRSKQSCTGALIEIYARRVEL